MNLKQQLIFLFSALGGINGIAISAIILLFRKVKRLSDYFLGALLIAISLRILKSSFLHFNPDLFITFVQIGLTACLLIGPFLFLYTTSMVKKHHNLAKRWWWQVVPFLPITTIFSNFYDHSEDLHSWHIFVELIYKQWFIYIVASGLLIKPIVIKIFRKDEKLSDDEFFLINVFVGTTIIWLGYETSHYTSYIVGAISFSFVFYMTLLLWIYKRRNKSIAIDPPIKYSNSSLSDQAIKKYTKKLDDIMENDKLYLNPSLTLSKLAGILEINSKQLSQIINQTSNRNYSRYIAGLRVDEAKRLLALPEYDNLKISSIAYDSGFNSLSSFNACFREETGITPIEYKKQLE